MKMQIIEKNNPTVEEILEQEEIELIYKFLEEEKKKMMIDIISSEKKKKIG